MIYFLSTIVTLYFQFREIIAAIYNDNDTHRAFAKHNTKPKRIYSTTFATNMKVIRSQFFFGIENRPISIKVSNFMATVDGYVTSLMPLFNLYFYRHKFIIFSFFKETDYFSIFNVYLQNIANTGSVFLQNNLDYI